MWFITHDLIWMVVTLEGHNKALIFIAKHQRLILLFLVGRLNHFEETEDPTLKFVSVLESDIMMKQQFWRLQQSTAATCGLGYCFKDFADIVCYYMINHKIRHLGNTLLTIAAFIRIVCSLICIVLPSAEIWISHKQLFSADCWPKRDSVLTDQKWMVYFTDALWSHCSLWGELQTDHNTLPGEKGAKNKNFRDKGWSGVKQYWSYSGVQSLLLKTKRRNEGDYQHIINVQCVCLGEKKSQDTMNT